MLLLDNPMVDRKRVLGCSSGSVRFSPFPSWFLGDIRGGVYRRCNVQASE